MNPSERQWVITLVAYNSDPPIPGFGDLKPILLDEKGNELNGHGSLGGGGGDRSETRLMFHQGPGSGPPAKLVLRMPTMVRQLKIPFSFDRKKPGVAD